MVDAIQQVRVLQGHTTPETAYVVDDYPYGYRLRCKIRYWIETAEKGAKKGQMRFMSQTTNPKVPGEVWNKPKASTYAALAVMFLDSEDHVQWTGAHDTWISPVQDARWRMNGVYEALTDDQRRLYDTMVKVSKSYMDPWTEFDETVNLLAVTLDGYPDQEPEVENSFWTTPGGIKKYMPDHSFAVYVAAARAKLVGLHYVARDGKRVSPLLKSEDEALRWLLRHQAHSTDHALKYEGYSIKVTE